MNLLAIFISLIGGLIVASISLFLFGISYEISVVIGLQSITFNYFLIELEELKSNSIKRKRK